MTIQNDSYPRSYFNDEPELVVPATEKDKVSVVAKSKTRRRKVKTAVESAQSKAENRKLEMYAKQESKRAAKVQVDQRLVLWAWILGIGVAFVSSAIVSFNGITSVAFFVGLSQDWMAGLFFFFVEIMYLLFLVAYLVLSSRIDENGKPEKTWGSIAGMIAFGGIAVLANAFHTLDYWEFAWLSPQMWAGLVLSVSAPIAIIAASKMASRVVFAKAIKL
jgi:cation transport ATPase